MSETATATNQPSQGDTSWVTNSLPIVGKTGETNPEPAPEDTTEVGNIEPNTEQGDSETEEEQTEETPQDEFLASLTSQEHAYYAKRYPTLYAAYQDPDQPEDLRQAFKDRVNQDHEFQKLRESSSSVEPTDEEEVEEEPEQEQREQPTDPASQRTEYNKQLDQFVESSLDKQTMNQLGMDLLSVGLSDKEKKDPAVQQYLSQSAPAVGKILSRYAVDLTATTVPQLLMRQDAKGVPYIARMLDSIMPGLREDYENGIYEKAWNDVRNTVVKGPDGSEVQPYSSLPEYGRGDFAKVLKEAVKDLPNFDAITFPGKTLRDQMKAKYLFAAKLATGQRVSPAEISQAIDKGKSIAAKQDKTAKAGKAMGSGRSKGQFAPEGTDTHAMNEALTKAYNDNKGVW